MKYAFTTPEEYEPAKIISFEHPTDWNVIWEDEKTRGTKTIAMWRKESLFKRESMMTLRIDPLWISGGRRKFSPEKEATKAKKDLNGSNYFHRGQFHVLYYSKQAQEAGFFLNIIYWNLYHENGILICSFTMVRGEEELPATKKELATVEKIISTMKID